MGDWLFFPGAEAVFADNAGDFFIPLATVDLSALCPGHSGPVHFLRPRMCGGDQTASQLEGTHYPQNWYGFRRDEGGRYRSIGPLRGEPVSEPGDPYDTLYCGNSRDKFQAGEIGPEDLLRYADLAGEWPNANWNEGRSASEIVGRDLRYLGELDTTNFCKAGSAGSVLLLDETEDTVIQVFHWT